LPTSAAILIVVSARFLTDDSCELVDIDGEITSWPSRAAWAEAWLNEWRRDEVGPACDFIDDMTCKATEGVVTVLATLTEQAAAVPDELDWVGAGPLEDLLSHSGNGGLVLDDVEHAALSRPDFAKALSAVWLGSKVDLAVKLRLVALGARDLSAKPR